MFPEFLAFQFLLLLGWLFLICLSLSVCSVLSSIGVSLMGSGGCLVLERLGSRSDYIVVFSRAITASNRCFCSCSFPKRFD